MKMFNGQSMTLLVEKKLFISVLSIAILLVSLLGTGFLLYHGDSDYFFKINKSIDIFGKVYKEVANNYVDEVDPEKFMRAGIDGMLGTLDPYTVFIDENEKEEFDLITTGKYGGVGITIGVRDGFITVISPMEGYSAYKQGIRAGDRILEINGRYVAKMKPDSVRALVRGVPGTELKMKIEREGEKAPLEFVLVREEIHPKNISYFGFVEEGIAYIKLERFTRTAGDEVRVAIKELKSKGQMKGVVLDLRDNPGGLLDIAVDIAEKFVPKATLIVSTRGRRSETEKKYISTEDPLLPDVPLAILVNRASASASEIVAGAIQDLDRGIIMGSRTFGKGLVQTISQLSYNTSLKMTTSKYYTPSGRSIQEIDYFHKSKEGVFVTIPDSLKKEYRTAHGRKVFEAGGITPDSLVNEEEPPKLMKELNRKAMFFKYANDYVSHHKTIPENFTVDEAVMKDFQKFFQDQKFEYQEDTELHLIDLRKLAEKSKYSQAFLKDIDQLAKQIGEEKGREFDRNREEIRRALATELFSRYRGEQGRVKAGLDTDKQLNIAIALLKNKRVYEKKLAGL